MKISFNGKPFLIKLAAFAVFIADLSYRLHVVLTQPLTHMELWAFLHPLLYTLAFSFFIYIVCDALLPKAIAFHPTLPKPDTTDSPPSNK